MRTPHPYRNLSDAELAKLPRIDAVSQFSTDELHDAARMIMPADEAIAYVNDLVALGPGAFMYGDILSALSLGSPRAALIVRDILGEDGEQERTRLSAFKSRYPAAPHRMS